MTVSRQDFEDAVAAYWGSKQTQSELSAIKDRVGLGTAGSVRAGKHFDSIAALLAKFSLKPGTRQTRSESLRAKGWDCLDTTARRNSGTSLSRTRIHW